MDVHFHFNSNKEALLPLEESLLFEKLREVFGDQIHLHYHTDDVQDPSRWLWALARRYEAAKEVRVS